MKARVFLAGAAVSVPFLSMPANSSTIIYPEDYFCQDTQWIAIAVVSEAESRWATTSNGQRIVTDLAFEVERIVAGNIPDPLSLTLEGGTVDGESTKVMGAPSYHEGARLLLIMSTGPNSSELMGNIAVRYKFAMDPEASLPSASSLSALWDEHCGAQQSTQSTAALLPLLPTDLQNWLTDWCDHL